LRFAIPLLLLSSFLGSIQFASAQSAPDATRPSNLSVFGAATGTYTGLNGGKNLGATAGADLSVHIWNYFLPAIEVRATYPFYKGSTDSLRDVLGGIKLSRNYARFRPYGDVLYGRAEIHYAGAGYPDPQRAYLYTKSPGNVLSLGGGTDFDLSQTFALKADAQWQRYSTPVSSSGHLNAVPLSLGVVYRFSFNRR
jgi:hypothetical protein